MSIISDFRIENGHVVDYTGSDLDIVIPDGPQFIDDLYWDRQGYLRDVNTITVPQSITFVYEEAFAGCTAKEITFLGDKVQIGDRAFCGCANLEKLNFASDNYKLGKGIINWCNKMADENGFIILNNVLYGYCGKCTDIIVPEGITEISDRALHLRERSTTRSGWDEIKIRSVKLPNSVRNIDDDAFINSDDSDPDRGIGESLASMRKRTLPAVINMPKDYLKQGKGAFSINMALLLIEGPWKNYVTEDDYIAMYLNQGNKKLLELCEKKINKIDNIYERLLEAMQKYNVNSGYERVVEWALKDKSRINVQQIDQLVALVKKSKAKKAIKLVEQHFK